MNPYFFQNRRKKELFGMYHEPAEPAPRCPGVVLCYPVGHEYLRVHWAFRRLAKQLEEAGFYVLRFDYSHTGDSEGDGAEGSVAAWVSDIEDAARELQDVAGCESVALVGVRFGAALATMAVPGIFGSGLRVSGLLQWDPVLDGATYLAELDRMQVEMLARHPGKALKPSFEEKLGFPYSTRLQQEIQSWRWSKDQHAQGVETRLFFSRKSFVPAGVEARVVPDAGSWDDSSQYEQSLLVSPILKAMGESLSQGAEK